MNLLLVTAGERGRDGRVRIGGRRLKHLREVLRIEVGDTLRVGELHGRLGLGTVEALTAEAATLRISLTEAPPPPLAVTLVLALPRPKMLRRILRAIAELGVKELHLINSARVEKSFWHSPLLEHSNLEAALLDGLEQARDTANGAPTPAFATLCRGHPARPVQRPPRVPGRAPGANALPCGAGLPRPADYRPRRRVYPL